MKQCMFTKCMWWSFYGASKIILLYNLNLYSPVCQLDLSTTRRTKSKENLKKNKSRFISTHLQKRPLYSQRSLFRCISYAIVWVDQGRMSSLMWYKTEMSDKEQQGEPWTEKKKKSSRNTSSKSAKKTVNKLPSRIHREIGKKVPALSS